MSDIKVGLQLYSVRDDMEKDMDATLKAVSEMGYEYVEFAGYFGKSAQEVKALLDKYGLKSVSVHQAPSIFWEGNAQEAIDYLKDLGIEYSVIPWYSIEELENNWEETKEKFIALAKLLKENGIKLGYHNHDFEFNKVGDTTVIDRMYSEIPADLIYPEFDTCWIKYSGNCPVEYLKKYGDRIDIVHLKDYVGKKSDSPAYALIDENGEDNKKVENNDQEFKFTPVGYGVQDFKSIMDAVEEIGAKLVIVEQDKSVDRDPMEAAKMSREYLKTLGY